MNYFMLLILICILILKERSKWMFLFLGNQRQSFQTSFSSWYYYLMNAIIQNRSLEFLKSFSSVMASWPVEGRLWHTVMGHIFHCRLQCHDVLGSVRFHTPTFNFVSGGRVLLRLCICVCVSVYVNVLVRDVSKEKRAYSLLSAICNLLRERKFKKQ